MTLSRVLSAAGCSDAAGCCCGCAGGGTAACAGNGVTSSDKASGEFGYLADKGLIPAPDAERKQYQAAADALGTPGVAAER